MTRTNFQLLISIWEFEPEFETLKDKKENSIRGIAACQTLLIDMAIVFSTVPAKNQ